MEKEVRFTEKKVDQSWKEEVARQKGEPKRESSSSPLPESPERPGLSFAAFVSSLGYQTLMHLGELPHPETREQNTNLEAAKETIDLLMLLQEKTQGNRTPEEDKLLKGLVAELQMKFVQKSTSG